jgi:hypothetical protein
MTTRKIDAKQPPNRLDKAPVCLLYAVKKEAVWPLYQPREACHDVR